MYTGVTIASRRRLAFDHRFLSEERLPETHSAGGIVVRWQDEEVVVRELPAEVVVGANPPE